MCYIGFREDIRIVYVNLDDRHRFGLQINDVYCLLKVYLEAMHFYVTVSEVWSGCLVP